MSQIAIDLPDEVFSARKQPPREFAWQLRLAAAMHWYSRGEISMEKAAIIAGLDRIDFLAALAAEQVEVFQVDLASLQEELNHV
jgi:predicted HTH domain antitoxin